MIISSKQYATRTGLTVKFENKVSFCQQCEFSAGQWMYLSEK